jgi:acyl-CoA synthetase (AMP-forming)/AMP-acid ligase II
VGKPLPGLKIKLVDDEDNEINDYNINGELCFRGPIVFSGYLKDPKANASAFDQDGWFKSGDSGYCDKESKLWYIVDRKKELIKVRGFQVAPPELGAVLLSHPEIEDAAVIGVEYENDGTELPRSYVVRRSTTLTQMRYAITQRRDLRRIKGLTVVSHW